MNYLLKSFSVYFTPEDKRECKICGLKTILYQTKDGYYCKEHYEEIKKKKASEKQKTH